MAQVTTEVLLLSSQDSLIFPLTEELKTREMSVIVVETVPALLAQARQRTPALIMVDTRLLPRTDAALYRSLRSQGDTAIVVLGSGDGEESIRELSLGADDYISRTLGIREIIARVQASIRRVGPTNVVEPDDSLTFGNLTVSERRYEARLNGELLKMTAREFDLLAFLANNAERVFSRRTLLDRVWNGEDVGERTVDVHIRWLREKIEEAPSNPRRLLTIRGVGYKFMG